MLQENKMMYTQNRELSWLKFNERVLEEAADPLVPLMERLKFISIFTSNLDEFFMVRVGSLFDIISCGDHYRDSRSNMTAKEQLDKIYPAVAPLYRQKTKVYEQVKQGLINYGVYSLNFCELAKSEVKFIKEYYKANIKPILSPQIVDSLHPFPHIPTKDLYIFALLKHKNDTILGVLPVPKSLPEVIFLPGSDVRFIRTEKVLYEYVADAFGKYEIQERNCLCITRNADIQADSESFDNEQDFKETMKGLLNKRRKLAVVRLEANYNMSLKFSNILCEKFGITTQQIFVSSSALKMNYVFDIMTKLSTVQLKQLTYPSFAPAPSASFDPEESIIKQIKKQDKLLFYPFESIDSFVQLIKESSTDPNVISIKITIYRLAKKAKIVDYLCAAAENGKEVTVVMELRARFDERNNIDWSEKLSEAGCNVIYGFDSHKIHSKICLITLKEKTGVSYISHVGTGNFNEKTSELYTDFSLLTADSRIGSDCVELFKNMSIGNIGGYYNHLLVAPLQLKDPVLALIDREISKGSEGKIFIKMNSLTDKAIIDKFTEASMAGVSVRLIIRGICCVLPQIHPETTNIQVVSVVGRFLEHSRVYSFGDHEDQVIYISSADLMTRNTEKRIEVAAPIYDKTIKNTINDIMSIVWSDNIKGRMLMPNGSYVRKDMDMEPVDSQEYFIELYKNAHREKPKEKKPKGFFRRIFGIISAQD